MTVQKISGKMILRISSIISTTYADEFPKARISPYSQELIVEWLKFYLSRNGNISPQDLHNVAIDHGWTGHDGHIRSYLKLSPHQLICLELVLAVFNSMTGSGLLEIDSGDFNVDGQDDR